jgi:Na+/citrate or Na+/malate symporter
VGLAGAVVGAILGVLGNLVLAVATLGVPVAATAAGAGAFAAVVGHYFGRDLRDGLTREL